MSRTLPSTVSTAITSDVTKPVYLIEMGFSITSRACTWDAAISWSGNVWAASGIQISGLSSSGAKMIMPTGGTDAVESDPWLSLVLNEGARGRSISIYEWHEDTTASPQQDAVLVFTGIMDAVNISDKITVNIIESSRSKAFPAVSAEETTFTHLMTSGDVITWGADTITVN